MVFIQVQSNDFMSLPSTFSITRSETEGAMPIVAEWPGGILQALDVSLAQGDDRLEHDFGLGAEFEVEAGGGAVVACE